MMQYAKWIGMKTEPENVCPVFKKEWNIHKKIKSASLVMTALGVYDVRLNGQRVSDYVLAPGWTAYEKRLQYQTYDITELVKETNEIRVILGKGWYRSPMPGWFSEEQKSERKMKPAGIIGGISMVFEDGSREEIYTDRQWECSESAVRFSEIYDGESYDATFEPLRWEPASEKDLPKDILIPQEGEKIIEAGRIGVKEIFRTPSGEWVVDFGQEVTGYVEIALQAHQGDQVCLQHGEILDQDGNFYNANYRSAKAEVHYICREGKQVWHPMLTFFGFRYIKLVKFPSEPAAENFCAVVVHSDIKKTGNIVTANADINQFISNVFWSQKGNFLDVPTDCPQRDERLGWTGDAQAFVKAASYNYDIRKFFAKWLHDLAAEQRADGGVGFVVPDYLPEDVPSAAWGDAAVICPWQIYQTYGDKGVLEDQFSSMKRWVAYIGNATDTPFLWTGGTHFGDWLGMDAPAGSYKGSTRDDFIASAFYAYSVRLLIKTGKTLGENVTEYEELYQGILSAFRKEYPVYLTQTEHVLAAWFELSENPKETADQLADMIRKDNCRIRTGFVGTPYILHVLSTYGHTELAYSLLLQTEYPSWIYSVKHGATTVWEHWDGIMENGEFWSTEMNSFNHYAYGSAIDWLYEEAAGIHPSEAHPGFGEVCIAPKPDRRLGWLEASVHTVHGLVSSKWSYLPEGIRYDITVPVPAKIRLGEQVVQAEPGAYVFWTK